MKKRPLMISFSLSNIKKFIRTEKTSILKKTQKYKNQRNGN